MSSPVFPLELHARIYNLLDNPTIAELTPEVFWAITPTFIKDLRIGATYGSEEEQLQNALAQPHLVFGSPVTRLQKDRNRTGLRPRSGLFPVMVFRFRK
jgi:hypothetical protein